MLFLYHVNVHAFNLVVNAAAKSSTEATKFVIQIQAIFVFLSGSTRRLIVLKKTCNSINFKAIK